MWAFTNIPWVKPSPTAMTSGLASSRAPAAPSRHQSCDDLAGGTYNGASNSNMAPLLSSCPRPWGSLVRSVILDGH